MPYKSKDEKKKNAAEWRAKNADKLKVRYHQRYLKHRDSELEKSRERYYENRDREIQRSRDRRRNHPEKVASTARRNRLKRLYGLSETEFAQLLVSQGNRCANAGCEATDPGVKGKQWHVDHDHKTGEVRGILCYRCNMMIGLARDGVGVLHGAIEYLSRTNVRAALNL